MLKKDYDDLQARGDWFFSPDNKHIIIQYGETRWESVRLPIDREGVKVKWTPNCWTWNGNHEKPSLNPSILVIGKWHGYLTDGELRTV